MKTFATYNGDEMTVIFQGSDRHSDVSVYQLEILGVEIYFDTLPDKLQDRIMDLTDDLTFDADYWA